MGKGRRRLRGRELVLVAEPNCIYCGSLATTTDHCPPRCFFIGRHWPEGFEFSCCKSCNDIARLDEQALSVIVRVRTGQSKVAIQEWNELQNAVRNNQPEYTREWRGLSRNQVRRSLRESFGKAGDTMRAEGWRVMNIGPLTQALIKRFLQRLAATLYYHRNKERFVGVVYYLPQSSYDPAFDVQCSIGCLNSLRRLSLLIGTQKICPSSLHFGAVTQKIQACFKR